MNGAVIGPAGADEEKSDTRMRQRAVHQRGAGTSSRLEEKNYGEDSGYQDFNGINGDETSHIGAEVLVSPMDKAWNAYLLAVEGDAEDAQRKLVKDITSIATKYSLRVPSARLDMPFPGTELLVIATGA